MGVGEDVFYDRDRVAVVPMAFCFPGYNASGADLPPPPVCARTWHARVAEALGAVQLRILVGGYAIRWHLGLRGRVADTVRNWRDHAPATFVLPHPSWRTTGWRRKHPFFEAEILPALRAAVREALA
jgi:uracil-DNA glycosylase